MLLVLRLLDPINQLLFVTDTIQSAGVSLGRIAGVTAIPDIETDAAASGDVAAGGPAPAGVVATGSAARGEAVTGTAVNSARATVRLRDVVFRYGDGPRVLDGIDVEIAAGDRVAVVGVSGAGKTTLAAVIAGIHSPIAGTVTRPTRTAVITQEVHVFAGTVRDNLTLAAGRERRRPPRRWHDRCRRTRGAAARRAEHSRRHRRPPAHRRRSATARTRSAAVGRSELAILDEATAEAGSTQPLLDRWLTHAARTQRSGDRPSAVASGELRPIVVMEHGGSSRPAAMPISSLADGVHGGVGSRQRQPSLLTIAKRGARAPRLAEP